MGIALGFVTLSQLWRGGGQQMANQIQRTRHNHRRGGLLEGRFNAWGALQGLAPGGAGGLQGFGAPAGMAGYGHDPDPIAWGQQGLQDFGTCFVGEHAKHPMAPGLGIALVC